MQTHLQLCSPKLRHGLKHWAEKLAALLWQDKELWCIFYVSCYHDKQGQVGPAGTAPPEQDTNRTHSWYVHFKLVSGPLLFKCLHNRKFNIFFLLLNSSILLIYIYFFFISKFLLHIHSVASTRNTQPCPWDRVREGTEPSYVTGDQTEVEEFLTARGLIRFQNISSFFICISTYSLQKKLPGLFCKN